MPSQKEDFSIENIESEKQQFCTIGFLNNMIGVKPLKDALVTEMDKKVRIVYYFDGSIRTVSYSRKMDTWSQPTEMEANRAKTIIEGGADIDILDQSRYNRLVTDVFDFENKLVRKSYCWDLAFDFNSFDEILSIDKDTLLEITDSERFAEDMYTDIQAYKTGNPK